MSGNDPKETFATSTKRRRIVVDAVCCPRVIVTQSLNSSVTVLMRLTHRKEILCNGKISH